MVSEDQASNNWNQVPEQVKQFQGEEFAVDSSCFQALLITNRISVDPPLPCISEIARTFDFVKKKSCMGHGELHG